MPAVLPVIGVAAAVAGVGVSVMGMQQQANAQRQQAQQQAQFQAQAIAEQKKAEALRRKAMELDAARRKREMVRSQVSAMGKAEAIAASQGGSGAGLSSALPGAYGGISGRTGVNDVGVNQSAEIGGGIFDSNARVSDIYRNAALAGGQTASAAAGGAGLASLGGMLLNNFQQIGQIGSWFTPGAQS